MPRTAVDTSVAVARLLRDRRKTLGLTLREVEKRTSSAGRLIPFSTLAKIEQGRLDPGIKRLHLLLRLYNLPIQMAGDLLDLEELSDHRPATDDLGSLYHEGLEAWKKGDTRKGLAHLLALREQVSDGDEARALRQDALHAFAVVSSSLGKYRLALQIVEDLLLEPADDKLRVRTLLQAARTWNAIGSPDAALAFLGRAEERADLDDHQTLAWIHHGRAGSHDALGMTEDARESVDRALREYRNARDTYGEARVYGMLVRVLLTAGDHAGALKAADDGIRLAESHGHGRVRLLRMVDRGRILLATGHTDEAVEVLNECLARTITAGEHAAQFYAHYHLWKAHTGLGDEERAELERNAACYYVRYVDESSGETREVRQILDRAEVSR